MIIHLINRQKLYRPNIGKLKTLAGFFLNQTETGKRHISELSLVLTDDNGIRLINRQFFDRDSATDVISFLLDPMPAQCACRAAEIVVNMERALKEGRKRCGFEHEFGLYLAHGCNHLAGHDDRTIKERKNMRRRELGWLKEAAKLKLLSGLFKLL